MYEIEEFYKEDGNDIKDILKSCIYNYYVKNKNKSNQICKDNQDNKLVDKKKNNV